MSAVSETMNETDNWIEAGVLSDIPRQGARVISTPEGDIALFRTISDEVFALRDKCPHKGGPLSQGIVHGSMVACPLHDWRIHLDSGLAVAPDEGCTPCFNTRVEQEKIFLNLVANAPNGSCSD
jgi:nitrite reductase (NADH) small subunit